MKKGMPAREGAGRPQGSKNKPKTKPDLGDVLRKAPPAASIARWTSVSGSKTAHSLSARVALLLRTSAATTVEKLTSRAAALAAAAIGFVRQRSARSVRGEGVCYVCVPC